MKKQMQQMGRLAELTQIAKRLNDKLKLDWENQNGEPWPVEPDTRKCQDASHEIPLADGGPDHISNIQPKPKIPDKIYQTGEDGGAKIADYFREKKDDSIEEMDQHQSAITKMRPS